MTLKVYSFGRDLEKDLLRHRRASKPISYVVLVGSQDDIKKVADMYGSNLDVIEHKEPAE
jgi:hypothetical protein